MVGRSLLSVPCLPGEGRRGKAGRPPLLETIIAVVAAAFGISGDDMRSERRDRGAVLARHAGMWIARHVTTASYPRIGRSFGNRDHTTVMHGVTRIQRRIDDNPDFADRMLGLVRSLSTEA